MRDLTDKERKELKNWIFEIIEPLIKQNEEILEPLLRKARMWYFPSMPIIINNYLLGLANQETEIAMEQIEQIFIHYYDENGCENLNKMVSSWLSSPIFSKRRQIIEDALSAHISGKFTLSVPVLLSQVEGILSDSMGERAGKLGELLKNAILKNFSEAKAFHKLENDILLSLSSDPFLINKTGEGFGEYFTSEKHSEWLKQKGVNGIPINRNAILHGIQIDYGTKANSLRLFFLLDSIHGIQKEHS